MENRATKLSALTVASLSSFLTPFMVSSVNVALPSIEKEFKIDAVMLSWVATAYLLAAAISLVPFGKLGDIHGRKKVFSLGISLFTAASLCSAFSSSALMLIFFRMLQGMGSAMIFTTGMAIITSVFPPGERGRAIGINVAAVYIGLSCGPYFGGILTQHFTWRSIFYFTVPLGIAIMLLVFLKLKGEWAEAKGESFDAVGSLIYCAALVGIMYGISIIPDLTGIAYILIGGMCLIAFVVWETRVPHPVFELTLFKTNRVFAFSSLAALIHYSATFAVTFLMSLYLQLIKGMSPQSAGLVLIAQPLMMALFSPFTGRLSDTVEPRLIASCGMALTTGALILLTMIGRDTPLVYIVVCLLLLGVGFGIFSSPNMNAIMSSVERRFYGVASGTVGTMRLLGQMLSMGIATLIFALLIGRARITVDNYPVFINSAKLAFVIFSAMCFIGIFLSLARGRLRNDRLQPK
jgi:EmrB/QacA subfamily drug resistance transporter